MKLYHFLVLSLFTFVSCDSSKNPFGDKNVYEIEETKKGTIKFSEFVQYSVTHKDFIPYQGLYEFKGKVGEIELDIHLKFTISDDDNCVYYIYTLKNLVFPKNQSNQVSSVITQMLRPANILMYFYDKEGNNIFTFSNPSQSRNESYPIVIKGKVKEEGLTEPRPDISAGLFRSKIERLHTHNFQFLCLPDGGSALQRYF